MEWRKLFSRLVDTPAPVSIAPNWNSDKLRLLRHKAGAIIPPIKYPIKLPEIAPNVVPPGKRAMIAMDSCIDGYGQGGFWAGSFGFADYAGFPGYPRLAMLSTRAEYRAMASALATELTREWIKINSTETASDDTKTKVTELTKALEDMGLQQIIQRAAEHDAYFGRAQIFIDIQGHNPTRPLKISPKTIAKDSTVRFCTVEAIWTTPSVYNAMDPTAPDFYRPTKWYVMGKEIHASRLMTVVTRPLPDMLKPAFNFSGMSLSQLAEPYVENWLRTRQSVSDLINNFSITALATNMGQMLTSGDDDSGEDLFSRADLFTALRSNRGLMLLDKETEELAQVNTPLSGLNELQAQAQEHMCAVSRLPAIILTGISPSGLNASSEGEIKTFYDWIAAQQVAYWRVPIENAIQILQLSMYGEIDPDITWEFVSLFQMTPKELSEIRASDATAATAYINAGVIDPEEDRERLARDPQSGYQGLDLSKTITPPDQGDGDNDNEDDD